MRQVFLDTVGLIALLDETDQWHAAADDAYRQVHATPTELVSTSFILLECGNAASRRPYRQHVAAIAAEMEDQGRLHFPMESEWSLAWRAYEQAPVGGPSIVDCISFEVMRRLGVRQAFTNDQHFAAAGFEPLF